MKIGYIILSHEKPLQLLRLVKRLESASTHIYIHIDKRVNINIFLNQSEFYKIKNLKFLKRYKSYWGGFGIVSATLTGMQQAVEDKCDFIILLSGSDYPIKGNSTISEFLSKEEKSFVTYYKMPAPHWVRNKEINRIRKFYYRLNGKLFEYPIPSNEKSLFRKFINLTLSPILPKVREFPHPFVPYGGDQWFCLTNIICAEVLNFYKNHPAVIQFLRYCFAPDEIFIQTAILNSNSEALKDSIINQSITMINWKDKNSPSPSYFEEEDFFTLAQSKKLFARKFDAVANSELLDKIDQQLLRFPTNGLQ